MVQASTSGSYMKGGWQSQRRFLVIASCLIAVACADELQSSSSSSGSPDFSLFRDTPDSGGVVPVLDATVQMDSRTPSEPVRDSTTLPSMDGGTTSDAQPGTGGCNQDGECGAGERCISGVCTPNGPADPCAGINCPNGFQCEGGECIFDGCNNDTDCPDGQRCLNGDCVRRPNDESPCGLCPAPRFCVGDVCAQCEEDDDCLDGFDCINFSCRLGEPDDDECRQDRDCDADEVCRRGECEDDPNARPCGFCPPPRFCVDERCAECEEDDDCPDGLRCEDLLCVFDGPGPANCIRDEDCPGGICMNGECIAAPAGENACDMIRPYAVGQAIRGNTNNGSSTHAGSCSLNADAPELVYSFVADRPGPICMTTNGSDFDTNLYVREGSCLNGQEPVGACNLNNGTSRADGRVALLNVATATDSTLHFEANAGTTYFVFIDGWHRRSGQFVLSSRPGWCDRNAPPPSP